MSIFDKFRGRIQKETSTRTEEHAEPKDTAAHSVETPVKVSDLTSKDVYSQPYLLQELYRQQEHFPQGPALMEEYLPQLQDRIRQHIEIMKSYATLKQAAIQAKVQADLKAKQDADKNGADSSSVNAAKADSAAIPDMPASTDAKVLTRISGDTLAAFVYVLPPVGEGKDITTDALMAAISSEGIKNGLQEESLRRLAEEKLYYQIFIAALGTAPVDGKAGEVVDHYPRDQKIRLKEDEKGKIDLRDLNLFHNIKTGDIICDIIPPEDGTDGMDVKGRVLRGKRGADAPVPNGKNTAINEEGTALISKADGEIMFQHGVYRVEPQLTIQSNVDTAVGNLDFAGDILIVGDVCQGFTVHAGGNVTVYGMAESGSTIIAGEDIEIRKGMNGGGTGTLEAQGNIEARFLEHVKVKAWGDVSAENIINCQIVCGGKVEVLSGRGTIIGGTICAYESVEARKIGTLSNNETVIKLGVSLLKEENADYISEQLQESKKTLDMLTKNYRYLYNLPSLPDNKKALFETIGEQKKLYETQVKELSDKLEELLNRKPDYSKCHVKSTIIYGITEITLGYSKLVIKDSTDMCYVYCKDNELVMGTF